MRCNNKWDFSDCHSYIIVRGLLHDRLHSPFYGSHLDSNYFPAAFPSNHKTKVYARITAEEKKLSWSTTWHILKNAVWFEHSKCTHIDRCSRLLSPSPANREHTQKWLLQAWRSETKTALSAAFRTTFVTLPFPLFRVQRKTTTKNKGEQTERHRQRKEKKDGEGVREYLGKAADKREDLWKSGSQNQFNHANWKYIWQQAARWQVSPYCAGVFIRMSNN